MANEPGSATRPAFERDMSGLLLSESQLGLPGHLGGIRLLKFTSDCRRFLFADLEMGLTVAEPGREAERLDLGSDGSKAPAMDRIHDIAISEDGLTAFVAAGLHLRCIDLSTRTEVWRYRPPNYLGFLQTSPRVVGMMKSKDVFVCTDSGLMEVFHPDGRIVSRWRASDAPLMMSRTHNGDLFVGSDGNGITLWDPADRRRVARLACVARIYGLCAFPNTERVAVRTEFGVSILDLFTGETLRAFGVLPGLPYLDVSYDGKRLLIGEGRGVAVYDTDGNKHGVYSMPGDRVISAVFHPHEGTVVAGLESGGIVPFAVS